MLPYLSRYHTSFYALSVPPYVQPVHYLYTTYAQPVHYLYTTYAQPVHMALYVLLTCLPYVPPYMCPKQNLISCDYLYLSAQMM